MENVQAKQELDKHYKNSIRGKSTVQFNQLYLYTYGNYIKRLATIFIYYLIKKTKYQGMFRPSDYYPDKSYIFYNKIFAKVDSEISDNQVRFRGVWVTEKFYSV